MSLLYSVGDLTERTLASLAIRLRRANSIDVVVAAGFEPAIAWMKTRCPRPLDDATTEYIIARKAKIRKSRYIRYGTRCGSREGRGRR